MPPKEFRIKDSFLEYLRKNIGRSSIIEIELDELDRVVYLPYYKDKKVNCFSFFWKGKDLIFSNIYAEKENYFIFNSWVGKKEKLERFRIDNYKKLFEISKENLNIIGRKELLKKRKEINIDSEKVLNSYFNKNDSKSLDKIKNKKIRFLERKKEKIEFDLDKLKSVTSIESKLKDLKIKLEEEYFILCGKKVKFEKSWSFFKKRDALYEKIKKIKNGINILKNRKAECEDEILEIKNINITEKLKIDDLKVIKPFWKKNEVNKVKEFNKKNNLGYEEYILDNKYKLGIGLNSNGNDNLRKFFGKKNDFWFHLENYKSCHCILKIENLSDITDNYFELIGSIIRDNSNLLIEVIPLVFTQVKNLKGVKGKPGAVTLKKEKYRNVSYNRDWREIISKN